MVADATVVAVALVIVTVGFPSEGKTNQLILKVYEWKIGRQKWLNQSGTHQGKADLTCKLSTKGWSVLWFVIVDHLHCKSVTMLVLSIILRSLTLSYFVTYVCFCRGDSHIIQQQY